jgi:Putative beta-barrel porin 2
MKNIQSKSSDKKFFYGLTLAAALVAGRLLAGPVIFQSAPPPTTPRAAAEDATNNDMAVFVPAADRRNDSLPEPFKWAGLVFRPHVDYQFLYVNGLLAGPGNFRDTFVHTLSPGFALDLGRHWTLDYTPSFVFYSDRAFRNAINHNIALNGQTRYEDWRFGFAQTYSHSDATLIETATQTKEDLFGTTLTASHQLNDKFSADLSLAQNLNYVQNFQDSKTWSTLDWLNYQIAKRLFVGVGAGAGYSSVDGPGSDSVNEQLQGRIQWRATDKLSFTVNGGLQNDQFLNASRQSFSVTTLDTNGMPHTSTVTIDKPGDLLTPIFGASIQYQPFRDTQISLSASRSVSPSLVSGSDTVDTSVSVNFTQTLLEKFSLNLGASYGATEYSDSGFSANQLPNGSAQLVHPASIARTTTMFSPRASAIRF